MENSITIETNFMSSKDSDETRAIHIVSDNIKVIIGKKSKPSH